jgi:regulator of replication initiation timing
MLYSQRIVNGANRKAARVVTELRDQKQKSVLENAELLNENKKLRKELWTTMQSLERSNSELRRLQLKAQRDETEAERREKIYGKRSSVAQPTTNNQSPADTSKRSTRRASSKSGGSSGGDTGGVRSKESNDKTKQIVLQPSTQSLRGSESRARGLKCSVRPGKNSAGLFESVNEVYIEDACRKVSYSSKHPPTSPMPAIPATTTS